MIKFNYLDDSLSYRKGNIIYVLDNACGSRSDITCTQPIKILPPLLEACIFTCKSPLF
ncbi:MAG: hypothetical protein R2685_09930 [Candidatus Nitrosocosmicus sp.]|nr:hypothetical protein [Candidatus Nitrosocosmicus sp.]